jgi:hypothetical protein
MEKDQHLLWNEQYLLEAFLSCNTNFKVIGALNYLMHKHRMNSHQNALFAKQP